MNFVMSANEQQAATAAMNGVTPGAILHTVLFCGSVAALLWACLAFVGAMRKLTQNKASLEEVLFECAMIISILLLACVYAIYS